MLCYVPYIAFQLFPRFYTLVPAGILVGLGAAPMWASKATYLTQVGQVYAKITEQAVDAIIVRFFGFFFLAWQSAELWGNLISSLGESRLGLLEKYLTLLRFPLCSQFCLAAHMAAAAAAATRPSARRICSSVVPTSAPAATAAMATWNAPQIMKSSKSP